VPINILINILWNHSDGRGKNMSQPVSTSVLLFPTNLKKKKQTKKQKNPRQITRLCCQPA